MCFRLYTSLLMATVMVAGTMYQSRTLLASLDLKNRISWWLYLANIIAWIRILILVASLLVAIRRGSFLGRFCIRDNQQKLVASLYGPLISSACLLTAWLDQIDGTIARDTSKPILHLLVIVTLD